MYTQRGGDPAFVGGDADYGDNSPATPSGSGASSGQPVMPRYRVAIMEDGAGNDADQIDMIELTIVKM